MKTEGGIIKHVQYFITLKLFRVHSPVILLLAGKGNGELCNGMEQSLEKPGAGWSWLFQRRLSLVCSHIGTIPSRKPKTVATVRNFFSCQIHCLRLLPSCLWYLLFAYNIFCTRFGPLLRWECMWLSRKAVLSRCWLSIYLTGNIKAVDV